MLRAIFERIDDRANGAPRYRVRCGVFAVEAADPVRALCRELAAHGHTGPITFVDEDGKERFIILELQEVAGIRNRTDRPPGGAGEG